MRDFARPDEAMRYIRWIVWLLYWWPVAKIRHVATHRPTKFRARIFWGSPIRTFKGLYYEQDDHVALIFGNWEKWILLNQFIWTNFYFWLP